MFTKIISRKKLFVGYYDKISLNFIRFNMEKGKERSAVFLYNMRFRGSQKSQIHYLNCKYHQQQQNYCPLSTWMV